MTVSTIITKSPVYTGDGINKVFGWTFQLDDPNELQVYVDSGGAVSLVADGFTVTGAPGVEGNVTFDMAPRSGDKIVLLRQSERTQGTDYPSLGKVATDQVERDFDRRVRVVQEAFEKIDRAPLLPPTYEGPTIYLSPPSPGRALVWSEDGSALLSGPTVDEIAASRGYAEAAQAAAAPAVELIANTRVTRDTFGELATVTVDDVAVGEYAKITSLGATYQRAPDTATDAHLDGGVKWYIADDTVSASALGATDAADPSGREAYAPALVTSMQDRKLSGVTVRDLLGRNYSETADAAVALNGFFEELAPDGISVYNPHAMTALCEEPIIAQSGLVLDGVLFLRGFANGGAMFTRDNTTNARVAATVTSAAGATVVITAVGLNAEVGEEVLLTRFDRDSGLQSQWIEVTAKAGDSYTLDAIWPSGVTVSDGYVSRINRVDNLTLRRVVFGAASAAQTGRVVGLIGHDMLFDRVAVESCHESADNIDGAFYLAGDRIRMLYPRVRTDAGAGMDGIRFGGGRDFLCMGGDVVSGDDALVFSVFSSPQSVNHDMDIDDGKYIGCRAVSYDARCIYAGIVDGSQQSEQMTSRINNFLFSGISGYSTGGRVGNIENSVSSSQISGTVRDVSLDCSQITGEQAFFSGNAIKAGITSGGIGKLNVHNLALLNNPAKWGFDHQDNVGASELIIDGGYDFSGSETPIRIRGAETVRLGDGTLRSGTKEPIIGDGGTVGKLIVDGARFVDVQSNKAGLQLGTITETEVRDLGANKLSGATNTSVLRIGPGKTARIGVLSGDVDAETSGTGEPIYEVRARIVSDVGDAGKSLNAFSDAPTQRWNTPLTANRTVTIPNSVGVDVYRGAKFRIIRGAGATGAFNLNIGSGPLKQLTSANEWADIEHTGSGWIVTGSGSL